MTSGPLQSLLVADAESELLAEFEPLDQEICERFGAWLEPELAVLAERFAAFSTPDSLKQSFRPESR